MIGCLSHVQPRHVPWLGIKLVTFWFTGWWSIHWAIPAKAVCIIFLRFYLFISREKGKEKERERNISVWLPVTCPLLGTWPATQACALTGNQTRDVLIYRPALNPLSHTSQGSMSFEGNLFKQHLSLLNKFLKYYKNVNFHQLQGLCCS